MCHMRRRIHVLSRTPRYTYTNKRGDTRIHTNAEIHVTYTRKRGEADTHKCGDTRIHTTIANAPRRAGVSKEEKNTGLGDGRFLSPSIKYEHGYTCMQAV